tara:strand:+ start:2161 stop:2679 length:519 start_codon:yes stop_codon:yes gene_type:complete
MIPNSISLLRIGLIVPIIMALVFNAEKLSLILLFVACITDYFDGFTARLMNKETPLGANLDLLADKLLISSMFIFIPFHYDNLFILIMAIIIVCREISVGILRNHYISLGESDSAKVNFFGKFKTFFQMLSIFLCIIFLDGSLNYIAEIFVFLACIFSVASLFSYVELRKLK